MAYTIEIKNDVINRITKGEKIKNISEEMEISISTIYKWQKEVQLEKENFIEQKETSKEIKKLIKFRKYNEALKFTEKYPLNPVIQSQKIKIYIKKRMYGEAKEIGKRFENNELIQSQMITIAIKEGDYKEAKEIGKRFEYNEPIQSQMITIAIKEGNYETAKEIGKRFKNYEPIQSQMITIAIKEGDYKEAKEIGKRFEYNEPIQSQMITIAIKEGDYKEAKEIGKRFENDEIIKTQINTIKMNDENYEKEEIMEQLKEYNPFEQKNSVENEEMLNKIKTKIYYGLEKIDIQEIIQNNELTEKQKLYVELAIYEKNKNIKGIKELLKQYKESEESKNINIILQRTQSNKKKIFNWEIYDTFLGWELDENLKNEYEQKIKEQKESKIRQREEEKRLEKIHEEEKKTRTKKQNSIRKQIINGKYVVSKKDNIANENIQAQKTQQKDNKEKQLNNNNFKQELKTRVKEKTVETNKQKHMYTEVIEYLLEKRQPIYIKMQSTDLKIQREGISQWDKLEELIEKTMKLKNNEDYMTNLYKKIIKLKEKEEIQR